MKDNKWYGYRPDLPDFRDYYYDPTVEPSRSVDLRLGFPLPPWNQGQLGSCTAHAVAGVITFDQSRQNLSVVMPSRLFQYYNSRLLEGTVKKDSGATIRDSIKAYNTYGACPEHDKPYRISSFSRKPSLRAYRHATKHEPVRYARVNQNERDMKSALTAGYPIVIGFSVYESFESQTVADTGVIPMPDTTEQCVGGHAVVLCGYDGDHWICRNSWDTDWGDAGYFYMPTPYLLNADLAEDFWIIQQIT